MKAELQILESEFKAASKDLHALREALEQAIVGQHRLIVELITAVFAGGHLLLEGLPGLGKTHLVKALSAAMGMEMSRIQCTPDLMPSDITGSQILLTDNRGTQSLDFRKGPIFSNLVLVDEINRATPKTQAALLEAMQETQVTHAGELHRLPEPFWVAATQNPIEIEGTYPLPEAQLDRFMMQIRVSYPDADALLRLLDVSLDDEPSDHLQAVMDRDRVTRIMALIRQVVVAQPLKQAAVDLVLATLPGSSGASPLAERHFRYGASPRGLQALLRAARVHAVLEGRAHVSLEDLHRTALPVLRHRVLLNIESELEGVDIDQTLLQLLESWRNAH